MRLIELGLEVLHFQPEVHNLLLLLSAVAALGLLLLAAGLLKGQLGVVLTLLGLLVGLHDCVELLLEVLASRR